MMGGIFSPKYLTRAIWYAFLPLVNRSLVHTKTSYNQSLKRCVMIQCGSTKDLNLWSFSQKEDIRKALQKQGRVIAVVERFGYVRGRVTSTHIRYTHCPDIFPPLELNQDDDVDIFTQWPVELVNHARRDIAQTQYCSKEESYLFCERFVSQTFATGNHEFE